MEYLHIKLLLNWTAVRGSWALTLLASTVILDLVSMQSLPIAKIILSLSSAQSNRFSLKVISPQVKSRHSETGGKTEWQNSASSSITKENSKENFYQQVKSPLWFFYFKCWYLKVSWQARLWHIFLEYFSMGCLVLTRVGFLNDSSKWRAYFCIVLNLLCVSVNSTDFALPGLGENILENTEAFSFMISVYIFFCSIYIIPFFYNFSNLIFQI